jgi:hypothetical protein
MATLEQIIYVIPLVGLSISIFYCAMILRNANKTRKLQLAAQEHATETRQAQLFMQIRGNYDMDMIRRRYELQNWEWDDYEDFMSKYGPDTNLESWSKLISVGQYFEDIGVLVKRGLIDPDLVDDLLRAHKPHK